MIARHSTQCICGCSGEWAALGIVVIFWQRLPRARPGLAGILGRSAVSPILGYDKKIDPSLTSIVTNTSSMARLGEIINQYLGYRMLQGSIIALNHNSANNRKLIIYKTSKLNWGCPPNRSFDGKIKLRSLCHLIHVYAWCNILMLTDAVIFILKCEHSKEELINLWHILLLHHSNVLLRGPLVPGNCGKKWRAWVWQNYEWLLVSE